MSTEIVDDGVDLPGREETEGCARALQRARFRAQAVICDRLETEVHKLRGMCAEFNRCVQSVGSNQGSTEDL